MRLMAALAALLLISALLTCAEDKTPPNGFTPLFNG